MAGKNAAVQDDELTQGPDNAEEEGEENSLDLTDDVEEEEEDEDDKKDVAKQPTVAELQAALKSAEQRAQTAARAVVRERTARKTGGVNRNGKANSKGVEDKTDAEDRAAWPEAARKAVETLERNQAAAEEKLEQGRAKAVDTAIRNGLINAGLTLPQGSGPESDEQRRMAFKRAIRMMDTATIEMDAEGDIVGVEDEIDQLRALLPNLFSDDAAKTEAERAALGKDPGAKKPRINPGGGRQQSAGAGKTEYPSTAAFLISKEYRDRNRAK